MTKQRILILALYPSSLEPSVWDTKYDIINNDLTYWVCKGGKSTFSATMDWQSDMYTSSQLLTQQVKLAEWGLWVSITSTTKQPMVITHWTNPHPIQTMVYIPQYNYRIHKINNIVEIASKYTITNTTITHIQIQWQQIFWMRIPWLQTASLAWSWSHHTWTGLLLPSPYPSVCRVNSGKVKPQRIQG